MRKILSYLILTPLVLMLSLTACQTSKTAKELRLEPGFLTIDVAETREVLLTVLPSDAVRPSLKWSSSDSTVVSVDPELGTVTGQAPGQATITVTAADGRLSQTCDIEVRPLQVTGLSFREGEERLIVGTTGRLNLSIEPAGASEETLTWHSSDAAVVRVEAGGTVTALALGSAVITASTKDGGVSGTVRVEVAPKAVTSITIRNRAMTLESGMTGSLEASVQPSDATDRTLEWKTSHSKVAKVDSMGKVTALAPGTASITATTRDGRLFAEATVEVTPKSVRSLSMSQESLSLPSGDTLRLKVSHAPSDAPAPGLVWSSGDEKVATVDASGKVTGIAEGKTTVTARTTEGKLSVSASVTVVQGRVKGITLDRKSLVLMYKGTDKLVATLSPSDAANQGIRWETSNYLVASVDETGNLVGKAPGTAVITAKSRDGGYVAKCTVTVAMRNQVTGELFYGPDKQMMFSSQTGGYKTIQVYNSPYLGGSVGESWNLEIFRDRGIIVINRIDFIITYPIIEEPVRIVVTLRETGKVVYDYNPMGWTFPE